MKMPKRWQSNRNEPLVTQPAVFKYYFPLKKKKKNEFLAEMIGSIFGKGHAQNEPGTFGIRNQRSYQKLIGTPMGQSEQ